VKPVSTEFDSGLLGGHATANRGFGPDFLHPVRRRVADAKLTLSRGISNQTVESQTTPISGEFNFSTVAAGLYFLRVESANDKTAHWFYPSDGYVLVEVDPSAKISSLNLFLDQGVCGELGYENRKENDVLNAQTN
jgi:hypothetical protein